MLPLIVFLQAAVQPDIQLSVRLSAERVSLEKKGEASLTVSSSPEGRNLVDVRAPAANGRRTLRNVEVTVDAEARIAGPEARSRETPAPPSR